MLGELLRRRLSTFNTRYLGKWLVIGGLVGVVAGLGSIAIFSSIDLATDLFLGLGAGYTPPAPAGEGETVLTGIGRRWMIPVVTTAGGLLSGLIVYILAPEAEGHGTDAAIEGFHYHEGHVRTRIPLVKLVASAITIGSGGSAGREGPTAQIAAGFGSLLGRLFHLSAADRRIAVSAGIGAGIGSIFKAPVGGALLSTEVLYLQGFEVRALVPSFIASIVGYSIYASWAGFTPIFGDQVSTGFNDPYALGFYALLGLAAGLAGWLYARSFYGVRDLFRGLRVPSHVKPAIGGLGVGLVGLLLPQVLGMGYGWVQFAIESPATIGLGLMIGLVFAKILATSLAIGSGGSGGVFAPGLFIGAMVGAVFWSGLSGAVGHVPASPAPFVIVGMMALFGGISRAPVAVMLMVAEMTGSFAMLAPAMVAVGVSYVVVGRNTIYESQVDSPAASPAHQDEYSVPLLARLSVGDAMQSDVAPVAEETPVEEVERRLQSGDTKSVPVLDRQSGRLVGIVSGEDILRLPGSSRNGTPIGRVMSRQVVTARPDEPLATVLERLSRHDVGSLPVVRGEGSRQRLVGLITRRDVSEMYARAARSGPTTNGSDAEHAEGR